MKRFFLFAGVFAISFAVCAKVVTIKLPIETGVYKPGPGANLANANCLTCHSADYVLMQPPMPTKFWKGEVDKMIGKYAAQIPTNQVDGLVAYFAANYGTETNAPSNVVVTQVIQPSTGPVDGHAVATKMGCLNCHGVDQKLTSGPILTAPSYKEVAAKYKGKSEGPDKIAYQITHGGAGQWGPNPMPPFDMLTKDEIKAVGEWILSQ